jgi:hypothetical protein
MTSTSRPPQTLTGELRAEVHAGECAAGRRQIRSAERDGWLFGAAPFLVGLLRIGVEILLR